MHRGGIGFIWDIFSAEKHAKKVGALYVNLANRGGFYKNAIITVHDITAVKMYKTFGKAFFHKTGFQAGYLPAIRFAKKIVTDSEFSKQEIMRYSKVSPERISVIYCGWEHMRDIVPDESVFEKNGIRKGGYFLSVSSVVPHKNFEWVAKNAVANPDNSYVVVGKVLAKSWGTSTDIFRDNVIYLGYQSDEALKALLCHCKALIFPSRYEGFGIPPLEALTCGAKAIVSDIPVMREIYGDAVYYLDPNCPDVSIEELMRGELSNPQEVLDKYTWERAAKMWLKLITDNA